MRKYFYFLILILNISILNGQVGIGTETPRGQLEITSGKDLNQGLVLPNVSKLEDVINSSTLNKDVAIGTIVYDDSRDALCIKNSVTWSCINSSGGSTIIDPTKPTFETYIKASNTDPGDFFAYSLALSSDGNTLAVGAYHESSNSQTINAGESDNSLSQSGAVYIYVRSGDTWIKQAYIKASNSAFNLLFGSSVSLSDDGNTLAVGAQNGNKLTDVGTSNNEGTAYVFIRNGNLWQEQKILKGSNLDDNNYFGISISLSGDGNTLAIGAYQDSFNHPKDSNVGAVYVFERNGNLWNEQQFITGSQTDKYDFFGSSVSLSKDGNTLAIGAAYHGIDYDNEGAVYVFKRNASVWAEVALLKASNKDNSDLFGEVISLSADGKTLAVGASAERSASRLINQGYNDNSAIYVGAVYIFVNNGIDWNEQSYIKASNSDSYHRFGSSVSLSSDGNVLAIGAFGEKSNSKIINEGMNDNSGSSNGAAYIFVRKGNSWYQKSYIKAHNTDIDDIFGSSISLSGDGSILVVGARGEASSSTVINQGAEENIFAAAGAAYVYKIK